MFCGMITNFRLTSLNSLRTTCVISLLVAPVLFRILCHATTRIWLLFVDASIIISRCLKLSFVFTRLIFFFFFQYSILVWLGVIKLWLQLLCRLTLIPFVIGIPCSSSKGRIRKSRCHVNLFFTLKAVWFLFFMRLNSSPPLINNCLDPSFSMRRYWMFLLVYVRL